MELTRSKTTVQNVDQFCAIFKGSVGFKISKKPYPSSLGFCANPDRRWQAISDIDIPVCIDLTVNKQARQSLGDGLSCDFSCIDVYEARPAG